MHLPPGVRVARAWIIGTVLVLGLVALTGCGGAGSVGLERPADAATAGVARPVPGPVGGQLRAVVPPLDTAADGGARVAAGSAEEAVLLFGDSVSVTIADELAGAIAGTLAVDGVDCRRLDRGFDGPCGGVPAGVSVPSGVDGLRAAVVELAGRDVVPDVAVLVIANNAFLERDDLDEAMAVLSAVRRVWWVTTDVEGRGWRDPNNAELGYLAERDERAGVIDWFAHGADRDWKADFVHPNPAGQAALARLIADHLACDCSP